ncbi:MAG: suppressor of fused domain protein [Myxococcales bacterium FL481]|nr:MAG: suppressor of fused domain protein [Myxococcales bacterium FL481]
MTDPQAPESAPGWQALDQRLVRCYPGQMPHQFTSRNPYEPDSPSPLPAVSGFAVPHPPGWHLITYGLSELFDKSSPNPTISGFGFEVTMVVPREDGAERPPAWVVRFLQAVGRMQLETGGKLDTGHCVDFAGSLEGSIIEGAVCVPDEVLGKIDTPNGSVLFLRLVGLTRAELEAFRDLDREATVLALAELLPDATTDLGRSCLLQDDEKRKVMRRHQLGLRW